MESQEEIQAVTVLGEPMPPTPQQVEDAVNPALPQGLRIAAGRLQELGEGLSEPDEVTYLVKSQTALDPACLKAFREAEVASLVRVTPKGERAIDLKAAVKELDMAERGIRLTVARAGGRPKPAEILTEVFGLSQEDALAARALKINAAHSGAGNTA